MRSTLLFFSLVICFLACNEVDLSNEPILREDMIGDFQAIPDLSKVAKDLESANLPSNDLESIYPSMSYTFNENGSYALKRTGLNMDLDEKGKWVFDENKISLSNTKGTYQYHLGRNKSGAILFIDNIIGESMNFELKKGELMSN